MKKTFTLAHPKLPIPRVVEGIKHEVRKYIKRERRRELPEKVQFWDFDCKIGTTEDSAEPIHLDDIAKGIDKMVSEEQESFYLEIIAKPGRRLRKPRAAGTEPDAKPEPETDAEEE